MPRVNTLGLMNLQRRAARLLGRGFTQAEVARRCGIGDRTIRDWLQIPDFRALPSRPRRRSGSRPRSSAYASCSSPPTNRSPSAQRRRSFSPRQPPTPTPPERAPGQMIVYIPQRQPGTEAPEEPEPEE
jgi:hypothetical protein